MIAIGDFNRILGELATHPEPLNGAPLDDHIAWSETVGPPASAEDFALEAIYVICNSGMKHTVARGIFERVRAELLAGNCISPEMRERFLGLPPVFGHVGKCGAIDKIWTLKEHYFSGFMTHLAAGPESAIEFCGTLPWIGNITKYHLAKNFGVDVAKPDVHLERLAKAHNTTPQALCDDLAAKTGYRSSTIDLILWMACAKGVINSAGEAEKAAA